MHLVLIGHGTVAPQIEALEPESWGVTWGVSLFKYPQVIDIYRY